MAKLRVGGIGVYLAVGATAAALYYIFTTMAFPGIPAGLGAAFGTCLPGLIITGFAILEAMLTKRGLGAMGGYTMAGVGLAYLMDNLTTAGILTAAMLAPATLVQVQVLVIVIGFIMGVVAYRG